MEFVRKERNPTVFRRMGSPKVLGQILPNVVSSHFPPIAGIRRLDRIIFRMDW